MTKHDAINPDAQRDSYGLLDPVVETGEEFVEAEDEHGVQLPDECPLCRYDLRGSMHSTVCPECGADLPETMKRIERRVRARRERLARIAMLRWIVYCTIPVLIWMPLAHFMYASGEILLMWLVLPTGIITAMGSAVYGSVQAGEEARDEGLGYVAVVCILLCSANFGVLFYVMTRLASF